MCSVAAATLGRLRSITVLKQDGSTVTLNQDEVGFSHRKTSLGGMTVLDVVFELEPKDVAALTKRMQKLWIGRNAARPSEERRIAVPFVDPDGMPAKELIQSVGLAEIREGNVSLDAHQPNFLVAHEGATSDQCLSLIEQCARADPGANRD